MNSAFRKLQNLAEHTEQPRMILGLMSGTSLDGLDLALCEIKGDGLQTQLCIKEFASITYSKQFLDKVQPLFAKPDAALKDVCNANAYIARVHAKMVLDTLNEWQIDPKQVDVLASHGQTIFHSPQSLLLDDQAQNKTQVASTTLQIGDGDHLAYLTGILTISDFRQKHVAANGEGAPLVPYADYLLFTSSSEPRVLLNIGGIANYTYLPINAKFQQVQSADTGPGNTLMDAVIQHALCAGLSAQFPEQKPYDEDGKLAAMGKVNEQLLYILLSYSDNHQDALSTGQELYNLSLVELALTELSASPKNEPLLPTDLEGLANLVATLNVFTATLIQQSFEQLDLPANTVIYISGGGTHNKQLMNNIAQNIDGLEVRKVDELGVSSDAKEAALFAVLANQTLFGDYTIFANENGIPANRLGKLSFPS